jgi:hypothetical protein
LLQLDRTACGQNVEAQQIGPRAEPTSGLQVWRVASEWAAESLGQRHHRRFPFPVLKLQPDGLQGAVVERRFNAARMLRPRRCGRTSPWFNQRMHRQMNDLARRLDQ